MSAPETDSAAAGSPAVPAPPPLAEPPATPPAAPPAAPRSGRRWRTVALLLFGLVAIGATLGWYRLQSDLDRTKSQLGEAQRALAAAAEQSAQRERDVQLRLERFEAELARLRDQRAELDQLYLDLTRGRDESALLEVERLVTLAAQELQISGSAPTALAALQSADARLARIERPQLVTLRRAIGRDIERLRAAPTVDVTGIALKLDQIAQGVEGWPLLAEAAPLPSAPAKAKPAPKADAKASPAAAPVPPSWWAEARAWLQQEFGDLVRIREVDTPEALLLTTAQQQLVRQQMRLRLLDARTALLMRNDKLYRADLAEAQALLARYFDTRQAAAATAQGQLKLLATAPLSVESPQIADSLAALRSARQGAR